MSRLSVVGVLREAVRSYRRDWWYLTLLALLFEGPLVVVEVAVHAVTDVSITTDSGIDIATLSVPLLLWGMVIHHFLSAVVEGLEAAERLDHHRATLRELFVGLPWVNLIVADLALTALTTVGYALLIVPGIAISAWFSIVLPLVNFERRSVIESFTRSFELTRPHFWRVLAVAAVAGLIVDVVQEALGELLEHQFHSYAGEVLAHLVPKALFLPIAALPIVVMMFELVRLDAEQTPIDAASTEGSATA